MIFVGVAQPARRLHPPPGRPAGARHGQRSPRPANALVALHDWTFLLGPGLMPAINALCFATILYRSRLVPRIIPTIGLDRCTAAARSRPSRPCSAPGSRSPSTAMLFALPIAAWELSFGVYMIVKGFRTVPAPIIEIDLDPAEPGTVALVEA